MSQETFEDIARAAWNKSVEEDMEAQMAENERRLKLSNKKKVSLTVNKVTLHELASLIAQFSTELSGLDGAYFNGSHTQSEELLRARKYTKKLFKAIQKIPEGQERVEIKISGFDILSMESVLTSPPHSAPKGLMTAAQAALTLDNYGKAYLETVSQNAASHTSRFIPRMLRRHR